MPYYDKAKGLWIGQVRQNGRKFKKQFPTKGQAKKWEIEFQESQPEQLLPQTRTISLFDFATKYLDFSQTRYVLKTYKEKQSVFRSLFKTIPADMSVSEVRRLDVQDHLNFLSKTHSGNVVNKHRKNLIAAWRWGQSYLEGFPGKNPFDVERFPEKRHPRYIPTIQDFWKVCEAAESDQDRCMLMCYLYFAARRNEVFSLKREDIDLKRRKVRLYTRKRKDGALEFDWIPIADQLFPVLKDHVQDMAPDAWVFPNPATGLPYFERGKWMRRLCSLSGVKPFGLHGIRHLTASILSEKNAPLIDIKTILRHRKITTTERYIHQLSSCRASLAFLPESPPESPLTKKNG